MSSTANAQVDRAAVGDGRKAGAARLRQHGPPSFPGAHARAFGICDHAQAGIAPVG